jgi:hypothetical protein
MSESTRRAFVKNSAGAAASLTVIGAMLAEEAEAKTAKHHHKPVVAYVRNARTGDVVLMTAGKEHVIHDRKLAAKLAHLAG